MRMLVAISVAAVLAGCGLDTASSAASAASLKKQELQEGQQTMRQAQRKIDGAVRQMQESAANADK